MPRLGQAPRARIAGTLAAVVVLMLVGASLGRATPAGAAAAPAWAKALGTGVTVEAPTTVKAGYSSPAAASWGEVLAFESRKAAAVCAYVQPSQQAQCRQFTGAKGITWPTVTGTHLGYVAIDGSRALVGSTGTSCSADLKPSCETNKNPAAVLDTNKTFGQLWTQTLAGAKSVSDKHNYSLAPCVKVGPRWYVVL